MTRDRVKARQATDPPTAARIVPCTIATVTPLKVLLLGSSTPVAGVKVDGCTYTSGGAAWAWIQEPAVGPVLPAA